MVRLQNFERSDFRQLIEWINTEDLLLNWSGRMFNFPLTEDSLAWYVEDTNDLATSEAFVYKAVDEDGITVGHISLGGISRTNKSARISRVFISDAAKGKGYCAEMIKQVLAIGFEQLLLHRIALGVYDTNASAIKCYEKAGMKTEGTNRDVLLQNGHYLSMIEMSMLEDEWEQLKQQV